MDFNATSSRFSDSSDDLERKRVLKQLKSDNLSQVENWMPREVKSILRLEDNKEDIDILMLSEVKSEEVRKDLTNSKSVGLTVIDEHKKRAIVVCLTTASKIYAIKPGNPIHNAFLEQQLARDDIRFFTIDGAWDAYILAQNLNIRLPKVARSVGLRNPTDLVTLDIHMSMRLLINNGPSPPDKYSISYIANQVKPRQLDFQQLVAKWLGPNLKLNCVQKELETIESSVPLNTMAKNAIKKRSALVRALGVKMVEEFYKMRDQPSKDIYSLALRAPDEHREDYERRDSNFYSDLCHCLNACPPIL